MSPQGCVSLGHPYHGCLCLAALSPEQSDPTTSIQKGLIAWHPAYHPACHSSKERLAELLSTFTSTSTMSSLTLHLHSPSSLPKCCWILPVPRFSEPIALDLQQASPVKKTEGRDQSWSLRMCNSG